jgi:hypothetical protein
LGRQRPAIAFGRYQRRTFAERPSSTCAYRIRASTPQKKKMPSCSKNISSSVRMLRDPRDAVVGVVVDFPTMREAAAVADRAAGAEEIVMVDVGAVEEMEAYRGVAPEEAEVGGRLRVELHRSDDFGKRQQ